MPFWVLLLIMCIPSWPQCTHILMATFSMIMHQVTKLKSSNMFHEHDNEFTVLQRPSQPFECAADKRNCVMQSCQKGTESQRNFLNIFWNPQRIEAVLIAKKGPNQYYNGVPNKVLSESRYSMFHVCFCNIYIVYFQPIKLIELKDGDRVKVRKRERKERWAERRERERELYQLCPTYVCHKYRS